MSRSRIYRAPYKRKPDVGLLAANELWDEAKAQDLRDELAALQAEQGEAEDSYEFGGSL